MEKITKFLTNYRSLYNIFKKLPIIMFFVGVALGFVLGIVNIALSESVFSLFLFTLGGAVLGAISSLVYAIGISPIVIIADANLNKLDEENVQ